MIPTAEEFLDNNIIDYLVSKKVKNVMIEFARIHVEAALKEVSEKFDGTWNKNTILNAYPTSNIK